MASIRIGISGWSYKDWGGSFYPDDLPREDELGYAAERFDTLEINGTFYDAGSRILLVTSRAVRLLLEVDYPEPLFAGRLESLEEAQDALDAGL